MELVGPVTYLPSNIAPSWLHRDLTELLENPYPGVSVFINDANIRRFCLVLTPPGGPWRDLALHFDVLLPENWPTYPPMVSCTVMGIRHPNLYGPDICCDLLKPQEELEPGYSGGYTPALTLRGIFLQFLTFFSSNKVEQEQGGVIDIGEAREISYAREHNLDTGLLTTTKCCRDYHPCCRMIPSYQSQLEQQWEADEGPVIALHSYTSNIDQIVHQVKGKDDDKIHRFERPNPAREQTYNLISTFRCTSCPYGSEELPHHNLSPLSSGRHITAIPPPQLAGLNCTESLVSFGQAYPRMRDIVESTHALLHRELACFYLRAPLENSILGIGVAMDRQSRALGSDFDWLSYEAFNDHGVYKSIQKRDFQFFLPLAFNRDHYARASKHIWSSLNQISRAIREAERARTDWRDRKPRDSEPVQPPHEAIRVLYKMMNNIVVSLMKSCDDVLQAPRRVILRTKATLLYASEKAVVSYCHLFHLIICLCRTSPAILRDATDRLELFRNDPASRLKRNVPDLGELFVLIILVGVLPLEDREQVNWSSINDPVLEEVIIRNVRWVLQRSPELEKMEEGFSSNRLKTTFEKSKTSLRLMMFQITFLDVFTRVYGDAGISRLDDNYGFADTGIAEGLVEEIKVIYQVNSWPDFFEKVKWERAKSFTEAKLCDMLRGAIRTSAERGYHTPGESRIKTRGA